MTATSSREPDQAPPRVPVSAPGGEPTRAGLGRGWSITFGVLLLIGGVLAVAFPFLSSIAVTIYVGWLLIVAGIFRIVTAFAYGSSADRLWNVLLGLVLLVGGGLIVYDPLAGALTLTVLLAAVFVVEGAMEIAASFSGRARRGWGWLLASGIVALIAGLLIAFQLPSSALWVVGFIAGIRFMFSGIRYLSDIGTRRPDRPAALV